MQLSALTAEIRVWKDRYFESPRHSTIFDQFVLEVICQGLVDVRHQLLGVLEVASATTVLDRHVTLRVRLIADHLCRGREEADYAAHFNLICSY